MRKVILSMVVSLDGYIEDSNASIDWHVWSEEMDRHMIGFFEGVDTILFGRRTYQLMADFWPTSLADIESAAIAERMNNLPKIVFSRTLDSAPWGRWNNALLIKENIDEEIKLLKQQPGKDLVIFGGAELAATFIQLGLIDEYQLIVNPVLLGGGKPLFKGVKKKLVFDLMEQLTFDCGNTVLRYKPIDESEKIREKLLSEFQDTMATLLQKFAYFDQDQLNAIPEDGGWTAGQVGSHLLKSYSVVKTLNGNTTATTRPPDEKVNEIREVFQDFDIKMDSPRGVLPSDGPFDHESLRPLLEERINQIAEVIRTKDLTLTCEDFAIPEYGKFTRLEWINFCIFHTQRHFRQLDRLANLPSF